MVNGQIIIVVIIVKKLKKQGFAIQDKIKGTKPELVKTINDLSVELLGHISEMDNAKILKNFEPIFAKANSVLTA